jgi:hypothetical protein
MASTDMCLDCSSPETALDSSARLLDAPDSVLRDLSTRELEWAQAQDRGRRSFATPGGFLSTPCPSLSNSSPRTLAVQGTGRASKTASDIYTQTRRGFYKRKDEVWQGPFAHLVRDRAIKGYEPPFHRSYTVCRKFR